METTPMKVEFWPTERPQPYDKNPRVISDQAVTKVAMSLREYGFQQPIVVDKDGIIIAGHTRLRAAKSLGLKKVPVVVADLPEEKARAYRLADNRTNQEASWDDDILAEELDVLKDLGFDLSLTGFDVDEIGELLAEATEGLTDPDETPEPPVNPVTQLGDVWVLGRHRIICGDSTKAEDVERVLAGVKPHLMVTDPPYGVVYDANWRNEADRANGKPYGASAVGTVLNDDKADWREAWALFPGDVAYVWHADKFSPAVAGSLEVTGFVMRNLIVWAKSNLVISRGDYHSQHEPCWYAVRKTGTGHWSGDRKQTTLWQIQKPQKSETGHSTQKPVECMKRPIENNSSPGQAVYEPFSGSGTTIIAAEMTGRSCHAIELNPAYVDVAVKRWQDFTGQKATLEGDGRTFEAIDAERYAKTGAPDNSAKSYDVAIAKLREAHEESEKAKPKKGKAA
jgi:DNA modification methylase